MPDPIIQSPVEEILINADTAKEDFFKQAGEALGERPQPTPEPSKPVAPPPPAASQPPTKPGEVPRIAPGPDPSQHSNAVEDLPEDYEKLTGSKGEQWRKLHGLRSAAEKRVKELESRLLETSKAVPSEDITKRLQELQKERDEYLSKLETVAFERSPRFQQQFQPKVEAALSLAKAAVGPSLASRAEEIFKLPDSEYRTRLIEDIAKDISPFSQNRLAVAISQLDQVNNEKAAFASQGSEIWRQWQQEEQQQLQQRSAQSRQQADNAFETELNSWKTSEFFNNREGDSAHNQAVERRINTAKAIYGGELDYSALARATLWASLGPDLVADSRAKAQRIAELESQISRQRSAEPGTGTNSGGNDTQEDLSGLSYSDAIAKMAEGILPQ